MEPKPPASITKRTPLKTTENIIRKRGRPKQIVMYEKTVVLKLIGPNPQELQQVAHHAHLETARHPLVMGGKEKRKVYIAKSESIVPSKIFDGII